MVGPDAAGAFPEHTGKRKRLDRADSRSGREENGAADTSLASGTPPYADMDQDSLSTFTKARLEPPPRAVALGGGGDPFLQGGSATSLMAVKAEPGFDGGPSNSSPSRKAKDAERPAPPGGGEPGPPPSGSAAAPLPKVESGSRGSDDVAKGKAASDVIQTSGAYCAREASLQAEEDAGRLKFTCHYNNGVEEHMIWLVGLKNIFARQLPNMPKEYIVRLVLDRTHKSMMIIKQQHVVGGITYRPYLEQKFGEIAFCAITASEQVKGYGTRLMNHLKQYARDVDGLTHFLTYADNNAVGYFSKQGFTKEISMDRERWVGYIKDYDGGTLMECAIDDKLPYTNLPAIIRRQRQAIDEKIRELSNCHLIFQGIEFPKSEWGVPRRPLKIEDIPGIKAAGWTPGQSSSVRLRLLNSTSDGPPSRQSLHTFMRSLLRGVLEHQDSWPFKEPVDARDVPDYYDIIKDPIDLKTMSKRLDSEAYYITLDIFAADFRRMMANARTYNAPETVYYKCAQRLEQFFFGKLRAGLHSSRAGAAHTT